MNIWRVSDGRRGHDSQSLALARAVGRIADCTIFDLHALPWPQALAAWFTGSFAGGAGLPDPDFIVGAGHGTHLTLLAARRARGGKAVVLMRPTIPASWFDCCIIPEHDHVSAGEHIIVSRGPMGIVSLTGSHDPASGLILVGGPSRHVRWEFDRVLRQIHALTATPGIAWTVGDSPRTPPADSAVLAGMRGVRFIPWRDAGPEWLSENLSAFGQAWVTGDSLSMIHEALSADTAVGVLELPWRAQNRVARAVAALVARGVVTSFDDWRSGKRLAPPDPPLREADRCAGLLLELTGFKNG